MQIQFPATILRLPADLIKGESTVQLSVSLETIMVLRDQLAAWATDKSPCHRFDQRRSAAYAV